MTGYDPARAAADEVELAAVGDAELVADIHAAAEVVLGLVREWTMRPGWRRDASAGDLAAAEAAERMRTALGRLDRQATLEQAVEAVSPVLNVWWPPVPAEAAVEELRQVAMVRPKLVRTLRRMAAGEPGAPPPPFTGGPTR